MAEAFETLFGTNGNSVIAGVGHEGLNQFGVGEGEILAVQKSEAFTISAEDMVIPPAAGNAAGAGIGNVERSKVHTILQVTVFLRGAKLADDHGNAVFDELEIQVVHEVADLTLCACIGGGEGIRALEIQREAVGRIGMSGYDQAVLPLGANSDR